MLRPRLSILCASLRLRMTILGVLAVFVAGAGVYWWRAGGFAFREARAIGLAIDRGQVDEANLAVERWLKSSPDSADAHYLKARIAWIQNDLATVEMELASAESLGYSWAQLARLRGLLLVGRNLKSEAEPMLRWQFDNSSKPDSEVADALARLYMETFRLEEAASVLERWMHQAPADAPPSASS